MNSWTTKETYSLAASTKMGKSGVSLSRPSGQFEVINTFLLYNRVFTRLRGENGDEKQNLTFMNGKRRAHELI